MSMSQCDREKTLELANGMCDEEKRLIASVTSPTILIDALKEHLDQEHARLDAVIAAVNGMTKPKEITVIGGVCNG